MPSTPPSPLTIAALRERYAATLPRLESAGLAYLRSYARLRDAIAHGDDTAFLAALAECQPQFEAWTGAGVMRRSQDDLWDTAFAPLKSAPYPYTHRQLKPYVPGVAPSLISTGELQR